MSLLPIFLKLDGRRCLLVGAGNVALDKIGSLLTTGLQLRVVAPRARAEVQQLAAEGKLEWIERGFEPADLDGNFLVIAATDSPDVNAAVYRAAVERKIACNSVDDIPNCDFFFGSVVSRGALQVAISTGGNSPAFAQRLRSEIDEQLPQDLAPWLESLGQLRREVLAQFPSGETRKLLLHKLAQREVCAAEDCPARQMAFGLVDDELDRSFDADDGEYSAPHEEEFAYEADSRRDATVETVHLVGAGPGDPELLCVKALRLIQTGDVILHDDLVPQAILDCASPSAEIVNVGKRCGIKTITQNEINEMMIEHARAGRSVIRLKSGDPLLFGRAAEEIAALNMAGIPLEIVPGITAACAAAASIGCSLTERGSASSVIFTTGHRAHPQADGALAKPEPLRPDEATRVVYMPGRDLRPLAEEWLGQGLPPELPCVVVSRAAQPDQLVLRTTLGALCAAEATLAPSLVIAGWALQTKGNTEENKNSS
jgi:uroporphyrin-III C-methyltransferase